MKKILYPKNSIIVLGLFTIVFSLTYLIFWDAFGTLISYFLYLVMTYSLIIVCIKIYITLKKKIKDLINNSKYLKKYTSSHELRNRVSLIFSLSINIIYALFKLITGIIFKSVWFISFSFYYLLLALIRTNILIQELKQNKNLNKEYIKYRNTAIVLLFTNVILTMIILIIVNKKIMNIYPSWVAIFIATYTFYLIIISIYNLVKYRKYNSPLISSSKVINVVTSLVSLISLEIVLIPTFGTKEIIFFEIMIMATGGGVALVIIIISLYMIIKSTEWLNEHN